MFITTLCAGDGHPYCKAGLRAGKVKRHVQGDTGLGRRPRRTQLLCALSHCPTLPRLACLLPLVLIPMLVIVLQLSTLTIQENFIQYVKKR